MIYDYPVLLVYGDETCHLWTKRADIEDAEWVNTKSKIIIIPDDEAIVELVSSMSISATPLKSLPS